LKKKGFKEERVTAIGLYDMGKSTTLESNKSLFQFLRNFHQLTAFEQAEMILYAALDPSIASKAKKGKFVTCLDHFELLQSPIN
jgi:hypothetical protein